MMAAFRGFSNFSKTYGYFYILTYSIFLWICGANAGIGVLGPPKMVVKVKDGLGHALLQPLQLWCQAVDESTRKAVRINNGVFYPLREKQIKFDARLNKNSDNASISLDHVQANSAGNWTCLLTLQNNSVVNGTIQVLIRPVIWNVNSSLRVETTRNNFTLEASGITVLRGKSTELTCPVTGNPKPNVFWKKENLNITFNEHYSQNGTSLLIKNATDEHGGLYTCVATNAFKIDPDSKDDQHVLILERKVRIKSQLAWLWPLIIIFVILILLIVIIMLCEFRRKRNEQKLILEAPDDE